MGASFRIEISLYRTMSLPFGAGSLGALYVESWFSAAAGPVPEPPRHAVLRQSATVGSCFLR